jgi:hypothetical protein
MTAWKLVPQAAIDWLMGEGPDADGNWFGDFPEGHHLRPAGAFWWRKLFRQMIEAAPAPSSPSPDLIEELRDTARTFAREDPAPDCPLESYVEWRAAAELSRLQAELDEAREERNSLYDDFQREALSHAVTKNQLRDVEADNKVLREALAMALPYIENLKGHSTEHVPQRLLDTEAAILAALGGQHGQ